MSKGLEAWKRLTEKDNNDGYWYGKEYQNDLDTIEKELKEKAELQKLLEHERELNDHLILHEVKALEIIKDRLIVEDKGGYIQVVCEFSIPSKSKKYDLLKEVLL